MKYKSYIFLILFFSALTALAQQPGMVWNRIYGEAADERAFSSVPYQNGFALVGFKNSELPTDSISDNHWIVITDENGNYLNDAVYGGSAEDVLFDVKTNQQGSLVCSGAIASLDGNLITTDGSEDGIIYQLNDALEIDWLFHFFGDGEDKILSIDVADDGSIYFCGFSDSQDTSFFTLKGGEDLIAGKLNSDGSLNWIKNYGGSANDRGNEILFTNESIYIAGQTQSEDGDVNAPIGARDAWLLQLDASNGDIINERSFGGTAGDVALSLDVLSSGEIVLLCETISNDVDVSNALGGGDFWILKINDLFEIVWDRSYGGFFSDFPQSITVDQNDKIYCAGATLSGNGDITESYGFFDTWFFKAEGSDGSLIWQRTLGGTDLDFIHHIRADGNGKVWLTGYTDSPDINTDKNEEHEFHDMWFLLLNENYILSVNDEPKIDQVFLIEESTQHINVAHLNNYFFNCSVFNCNGQLVMQSSENKNFLIEKSHLQKGHYILQLKSYQDIKSMKFSVQ